MMPREEAKEMAKDTVMTTLSIPTLAYSMPQRDQVEWLVYGFERYLRGRRGRDVAKTWRKTIDEFLTTPGATYDRIKERLEQELQNELRLTQHELEEMIQEATVNVRGSQALAP